ncbi:Histidinol dehydrogenase, partial [ANME-1 cluster archaeon GoMg2]|nr:Histidinol dehydrogenase [ANME-1 cluster archaeon GoMg2]
MIMRLKEIQKNRDFFSRTLDLTAVMPVVEGIIAEIKTQGDEALRAYTEKFDGVNLKEIEVKRDEIEAAKRNLDSDTLRCIKEASTAIRNFHYRQKRVAWLEEFAEGVFIGEKYMPFDVVGAYVPASYFSTALMCVIPAKIAGVRDIVVCTPPGKDGTVDPYTLVAANLAGATRIFKVGGAQAIAALAFGTETVPKVQKIVGPGNVYVTVAKMLVRDEGVEIDFPAGPSEILIIGDETANPAFIAADMLAQVEHGAKSKAILVTDSERLAAEVEQKIKAEAGSQSWILIGDSMDECIDFANEYAPEHLEIMVREPMEVLKQIRNAGSVFVGNYSPVAVGDYATGANHVLPTAGYARLFSGLDVDHFMHRMTVQWLDKAGLE